MIHSLYQNRLLGVGEQSEKSVVTDAELVFIRANEPSEVVGRVGRCPLQAGEDATCDLAV